MRTQGFRFLLAGLLCAVLLASPPATANADDNPQLPDGVASWHDIDQFLASVRKATETMDAAAWARLIDFPLVWRDGCRTVRIRGVADLRRYLPQMMTTSIRADLMRPGREALDVFPMSQLALGNGRIGVRATARGRLRIEDEWASRRRSEGREAGERCPLLTCHTRTHWHKVEGLRDQLTYSSGRLGRERPDTVMTQGREGSEGTSGCAHSYWVFHDKLRRILLMEPGCGPEVGLYQTVPFDPADDAQEVSMVFGPGGVKCRVIR